MADEYANWGRRADTMLIMESSAESAFLHNVQSFVTVPVESKVTIYANGPAPHLIEAH